MIIQGLSRQADIHSTISIAVAGGAHDIYTAKLPVGCCATLNQTDMGNRIKSQPVERVPQAEEEFAIFPMRDLDDLFSALGRSRFRSRFRLGAKERAYLAEKTLPAVLEHGRKFLHERLAPAEPKNDGRQTPMRGHPIFLAQHATAVCCRGCLEKWHGIPKGRPLTEEHIEYLIAVLARWLNSQIA